MESRIKTIGMALRNLDITDPNFNAKKETLVTEYEKEKAQMAYISRCIHSGAPEKKIKEAGFHKWISTNEREREFQSLLTNYAMKITGLDADISCSSSGNFVISGKSGTGKTFGACSLIKYLSMTTKKPIQILKHDNESDTWQPTPIDLLVYRTCYYAKASRLVAIQQDRNNPAERNDMRIGTAKSDFVVIDEIGRCLQPKAEREVIFDILDNRHDAGLPTMLISNFEDEELAQHLGSAIMSRLLSDCVFFNTAGINDRRSNNYA